MLLPAFDSTEVSLADSFLSTRFVTDTKPFHSDAAIVVIVGLFSSVLRNSRMRFRSRILRFRSRPNRALSPFLFDTVPPLNALK